MHKKSAIKRVDNERKLATKGVVMYKRKIENVLQSWLDDASHKPLVVKGVRQCGKTSSVMDFAQKLNSALAAPSFLFHKSVVSFD